MAAAHAPSEGDGSQGLPSVPGGAARQHPTGGVTRAKGAAGRAVVGTCEPERLWDAITGSGMHNKPKERAHMMGCLTKWWRLA